MKKIRAFTLLELLIASAIFVVVMFTIYNAFRAGLTGYKNIDENIEIFQAAKLILERIDLDLVNSIRYSNNETRFEGDRSSLKFFTLVNSYSEGNVAEEYAFVDYELVQNQLTRLCRLNLDILNESPEVLAQEMSDNIEEVTFSYIYKDSRNELAEKESWGLLGNPDEERIRFPLAVKVRLTIKSKPFAVFERKIFLASPG